MNTQQLLQLFFDLVTLDSPSGEEAKVAEYILAFCHKLHIFAQKDSFGNVFVSIPGEGDPILFSAHMDTVQPGRNIKPRIENGYVVSDGTTILGGDNKIALACFLFLMPLLQEKKHRSVEFLFTRFEESGNFGSAKADYRLIRSTKGYCFDFSEPVGSIILSSPYYERFDIAVKGKAAHASRPHEAENIIPILTELLRSIPLGAVDEDTFCNIGYIKAGNVRNTIPGDALLHGEIRSFTESDLEKRKAEIIALCTRLHHQNGYTVTTQFLRENPGYKHTSSEALQFIEATEQCMKSIGITSKRFARGAISDVNIFNEKGILSLDLGDGGEFAHTTHERVKITEMEKLVQLMFALVHSDV